MTQKDNHSWGWSNFLRRRSIEQLPLITYAEYSVLVVAVVLLEPQVSAPGKKTSVGVELAALLPAFAAFYVGHPCRKDFVSRVL